LARRVQSGSVETTDVALACDGVQGTVSQYFLGRLGGVDRGAESSGLGFVWTT
jgi:hypothetical protein